jgi:hypothetical protein
MGFESVRAYLQLASGLSDLTRARAMEAAQGLLTLPASRAWRPAPRWRHRRAPWPMSCWQRPRPIVRTSRPWFADEVDAAIMTRLGLVPVQKLEEAQAEAARLQKELVRLQSASSPAAAGKPACQEDSRWQACRQEGSASQDCEVQHPPVGCQYAHQAG